MKRIVILGLALSLIIGAVAVYASTSFTIDSPMTLGSNIQRPSSNVTVIVNSNAFSFALTAKHLNGDRQFGTASDDAGLYYTTTGKGTAAAAPGASDSTAFNTYSRL